MGQSISVSPLRQYDGLTLQLIGLIAEKLHRCLQAPAHCSPDGLTLQLI
eukprot:SAG31_NODE_13366_length_874_cov_1.331613_1_plen_48_part_10